MNSASPISRRRKRPSCWNGEAATRPHEEAEGAREAFVIVFAREGNAAPFLRDGWHDGETDHRWTRGARSELALPPFAPAPEFALTLECAPLAELSQTMEVEFNGVVLAGVLSPSRGAPCVVDVPGELVNAGGENRVVFHHPRAAAPALLTPGEGDARSLAYMWRTLRFEARAQHLFAAETLAPPDLEEAPATVVLEAFQSLGQNSEFALFQQRCGVEPRGLLSFGEIHPDLLLIGLSTRFADIGEPDALSFVRTLRNGWVVAHEIYGLRRPASGEVGEAERPEALRKEARRLAGLARALIEEIAGDRKIFVRCGGFETEAKIARLWRLLQTYNSRPRLLVAQTAPSGEPAKIGRVERLAPGLYRGFLSRFADPRRFAATTRDEEWLSLCAAVHAAERARGRARRRS